MWFYDSWPSDVSFLLTSLVCVCVCVCVFTGVLFVSLILYISILLSVSFLLFWVTSQKAPRRDLT